MAPAEILAYLTAADWLVLANKNDKLAGWAAHRGALSHWAAPGKEAFATAAERTGSGRVSPDHAGFAQNTARDLGNVNGIRESQNLGTIYRISLTEVRDAGFSGIRNDRPFQSPSFRPLNNAFNAQQKRELEDHLEASVCEKAGVFIKPFNIMGSWPIADNLKYEYHLSSKRKSCLIQLWPAKSEYL